jgi:enoyl-CoA hydratase/carnithine racemase
MPGDEALQWGFFNRVCEPSRLGGEADAFARSIAEGPIVAHRATKRQLVAEWNLDLIRAVQEEAREQAVLMRTGDFRRAYEAFVSGRAVEFKGD